MASGSLLGVSVMPALKFKVVNNPPQKCQEGNLWQGRGVRGRGLNGIDVFEVHCRD